jgi:hypothetical protein
MGAAPTPMRFGEGRMSVAIAVLFDASSLLPRLLLLGARHHTRGRR